MRLWNRILTGQVSVHDGNKEERISIGEALGISAPPVVLLDGIAQWFDAGYTSADWEDFIESACVRLPFPEVLMEWRTGRGADGRCAGVSVKATPGEMPGSTLVTLTCGLQMGSDRFERVGSGVLNIDPMGRPLPGSLKEIESELPEDIRASGLETAALELQPADCEDDDFFVYATTLNGLCALGVAGLTFMNCRNVVLRDPVAPKQKKAFERRHGCKPARYYTLDIAPLRKAVGPEMAVGSGISLARALHLCRGHFKDFSAEKPLFGKLTGRYWWSPQVRGKAEAGVVVKDYNVLAPAGPMPSGGRP